MAPIRIVLTFALINFFLGCFAETSKSAVNSKGYFFYADTGGYNIQNSLPSDFVKDGSVDYTKYVQDAISHHDSIVFPSFPILINDSGLTIGSNKVLTFLNGSKILLKSSQKTGYYILLIKNATNVTVNNAVIVGDRDTHIGKQGEWGMGLGIISSSNIVINNPNITDCWGDGIYLGETGKPNTNITISNAYIKNNRRNGISVISVNGLKLISPYLGFENGTAPMSGIDLEPNGPQDELKNIEITDPVTENNKGEGILMFLDRMYSDTDKDVSITINNHKDNGSSSGFRVICNKLKPSTGKIGGTIITYNPSWKKNTRKPLDATDIVNPNLQIVIKGAIIDNKGVSARNANSFLKKAVSAKGNFKITN
jgi:hypothetical protein